MGENESPRREGPQGQGLQLPRDGVDTDGVARTLGGRNPNEGHHGEWLERDGRHEQWSGQQEKALKGKLSRQRAVAGVAFRPANITDKDLLRAGKGTATLAAGNFEGVIADRLMGIGAPASPETKPRWAKWRWISEERRKSIVDRFVKGEYDAEKVLNGENYKQTTLNEIAKQTMRNGTYLPSDGQRVLKKVQSLLPAVVPAAGTKQKQKQAK